MGVPAMPRYVFGFDCFQESALDNGYRTVHALHDCIGTDISTHVYGKPYMLEYDSEDAMENDREMVGKHFETFLIQPY